LIDGRRGLGDHTFDSSQILDPTIVWLEGDAEQLPLESESMDAYSIAFGIRNCTDIERVLQEAYRVLRRGGRFLCLEFSHVQNGLLSAVYDAYSFHVIPWLGDLIAKDRSSYQYLVESIRQFPDQETFKSLIEQQGFKAVTYTNLTFGIAAIHSAFKL
jgi:2-methoxy-6-polyprenyl-1,4-benzoquinol methylase